MDQVRPQLPFCSNFYACKLLEILYLFVSQQSVNLKQMVMLTQKREHLEGTILTVAIHEAYNQRRKAWGVKATCGHVN